MPNTFELIASSTVGAGGAASIEFTSIPNTFTDLIVKVSARTAAAFASDEFYVQFNGSTSSLTYRSLIGTPESGTATSNTSSSGYLNGNTATASTFGNAEIYIPNYAGSTNKSVSVDSVNENNASTTRPTLNATLWSNTAAITSLKIISATSSTIQQYSTAYLYGVKNA
jgi:hypothetical protein